MPAGVPLPWAASPLRPRPHPCRPCLAPAAPGLTSADPTSPLRPRPRPCGPASPLQPSGGRPAAPDRPGVRSGHSPATHPGRTGSRSRDGPDSPTSHRVHDGHRFPQFRGGPRRLPRAGSRSRESTEVPVAARTRLPGHENCILPGFPPILPLALRPRIGWKSWSVSSPARKRFDNLSSSSPASGARGLDCRV